MSAPKDIQAALDAFNGTTTSTTSTTTATTPTKKKPATKGTSTNVPTLPGDLARVAAADEVAVARARLDTLTADLDDARIAHAAALTSYEAAQRAWERAETHTAAQAERLTRLHTEVSTAAQAVTDLETRISETRETISKDEHEAGMRRRAQIIAETWPPAVRQMIAAAQAWLAALEAQQHAWDVLCDAEAWGGATPQPFTMPDQTYNDVSPQLRKWLAECRAAGYTVE